MSEEFKFNTCISDKRLFNAIFTICYHRYIFKFYSFFFQGKLVKLFSRQLVAKQKCNEDWNDCEKLRYYPKLEQWLQVVGINEEAIKVFVLSCHSLTCKIKSLTVIVCTMFVSPHPYLNFFLPSDPVKDNIEIVRNCFKFCVVAKNIFKNVTWKLVSS